MVELCLSLSKQAATNYGTFVLAPGHSKCVLGGCTAQRPAKNSWDDSDDDAWIVNRYSIYYPLRIELLASTRRTTTRETRRRWDEK